MIHGWLAKAGPYVIEHVPCPYPGLVNQKVPPKGVLHTTEGSLSSALTKFKRVDAPTFLVGEHRILQLIPLGSMAAALVHSSDPPTNGHARVQIEMATFSQHKLWVPGAAILNPTAALLCELDRLRVVPLQRFRNPHRDRSMWTRSQGWCGHQDVPENSHWDPGELDWHTLFRKARSYNTHGVASPHPRPRKTKLHARLTRFVAV